MLRYLALGLATMAIVLSTACSSTTNVTGVSVPSRDVSDVNSPSTGDDRMDVNSPSTGDDRMDVNSPSTGDDRM